MEMSVSASGLELWCLTLLSTIFQLYRGGHVLTVFNRSAASYINFYKKK